MKPNAGTPHTRAWMSLALAASLATVFGATGVTHADTPVPAVARSRTLEALWYRDNEPGKPRLHGVTKIRATISANPDRGVRIGVFEEFAGATGAQWRTSIWVASFIAAVVTGSDLTHHRYDISTGGYIDGPSAGALMAVGFIAAIAGDALLPEVSMTGTLAPDGSVGPVGGIPDKVLAAKAAKKRILGIPAGQAFSAGADGSDVDVIALGRSVGVEVRELGDIYEAYALLTGRTLPRGVAVPPDRMAVPPKLLARLRRRAEAMTRQATADLALLKGDKTPGLGATILAARKELRALNGHLRRKRRIAVYERAKNAAALARAALRVASLAGSTKYEAASGSLEQTEAELTRVEQALEAASREAAPKALVLLSGYGAVARARGALELARTILSTALTPDSTATTKVLRELQIGGKALLPAMYLSYADLALDYAREVLRGHIELYAPLEIDRAALARATNALVSAASGNIGYIDALLLSDLAKARKVSLAEMRTAFAQGDHAYLLASQMSELAVQGGMDGAGPSVAAMLMRLQAASASYVESASIIAKYYSLDLEVAEEGREAKVRRQKALSALITRAELASREAASAAESRLGVIPPDARYHYRCAVELLAEGTPLTRLRALAEFWRSTVESRTALMVLRRQAAPLSPASATDVGAPP